MFPQLKLTPTRAAFARPGPDATPFPDVNALMQPSDSLVPFGRRSGLPSPTAYLGAENLFFTAAPVPRQPVPRRRYFYPGSPSAGSLPRRNEGIPGAWAILFVRAVVVDPAGCNRPSPALGAVTVVFRRSKTLDTRKLINFVAAQPTAHMLAYLRIAESVTVPGARLATGPGGLTLGRAGFAPAG